MNSREVGRGSRPLPGTSVTEPISRPDEMEPPWQPLSSPPPASAEQGAPPDGPPPLEGFIKHYEIIRKLGEGGMGIVLLARDTKLGRLVAIKLLQDSGRATSRLLAEARATARCRHDCIVVIHDVDETDGHPYMVLEYLEGRTLRDVLSSGARGASRALPHGLALDIVTSVIRALAVAHKRDVVHRDLKPENIMILDTGQVKVLDFGLARRSDPIAPGARGGTLPYMAPEQWLGGNIDARTDLWAVGVLLYELLAGAHPLAPFTRERLESVSDMDAPMPRLRDVRPELAALSDIVERCLRKRREERFGSAEELLSALEPSREGGKPVALAEGELPFAGLSAFQESDAGRFFGRERDIAAVVGRLRRQRLVTVAGPSGAGKSSFIRAGVIPALKRSGEDWDVLVLRPGRAPVSALGEALAEALGEGAPEMVKYDFHAEPGLLGTRLRAHCRTRGAGRRALVFVDQFEELYTLVSDPGERAAFIKSLLGAADEASSPLRVVLSIRSDFLDRIADDRHFMAEVTSGLFLLPPVAREGLREALVRPVEAAGHRFESEAMITDILDELARAKTPLPLLQFSAAELWEARDRERKVLTRGSYDRLGGVAGSLSTHADAVFAGLLPSDQRLCQAIFLRLVTPERTRAIVSMPDLASLAEDHAAAEALVHHLCGARLLLLEVGGEQGSVTVEMVHESLIERWPRLARWLDESTADAQFLARLRAAASQWKAGGEAPGLLWRDRAAAEARAWHERRRANPEAERGLPLGRPEKRYLLSVIALFERARRRRQRSIAGAFAFLAAVSVLVFFLAMRAQNHAKRADAEAARVKEQNGELAFQALRGRNAMRMLAARKRQDDPTLVLALSREVEPEDIPKEWPELVSGALSSGVARDELLGIHEAEHPIYAAAISPDGTRIVTASGDKTAQVLSVGDYRKLASLRGHDAHVWSATWSPDGKRVVTASGDKTARIWNADGSGEPLVLRGHEAALNSAAMSSDGKRVVTASDDGTARVFSAADGRQLVLLRHAAEVTAAQFSPDGKRVVTASIDGIARVWDAGGRGGPLLLRGHADEVVAAAWSPDGARIATASKDSTVRVWDAFEGAERLTLRGHEDKVMSVAWSLDGKRIASASKDKTARIWNADGVRSPIVLRGHKHWVYTANFSPDNHHLVTASLDRTIRFWDIDEVVAPTVLVGHTNGVNAIGFSPDGARIVTASEDGTARVWNADGTGSPVVLRGHTGALQNAMFSPDGARIVTISQDRTARIWNADGASAPIVLKGHRAYVWGVDWSSAGDRIVTASTDGVMRLWRSDGWEVSSETSVETAKVYVRVHFDREGRRIVASNGHENIYLWNLDEAGGPVVLGRHDAGSELAQWSPDSSRVVTSSVDKTARIWDVRGAAAPIVLRGHESEVTSASWSPDGKRIVTTSKDTTARVWNADGSGQPVILQGHGDALYGASYSPDGTRIATASKDTTVRVWNADGSGAPFVLGGSPLAIWLVVWSPDGKYIAHHSEEKVARVWRAVRPFSGPGDARIWRATSYCIPAPIRIDLLHVTEAEARKDQEACERRVEEARAAEGGPGGTPPRDTVRP
jgi:WD40 repeat protein